MKVLWFFPGITARIGKMWDQKTGINIAIVNNILSYHYMVLNFKHWAFKMLITTDLVMLLYQSLSMYLPIHTLIQALCHKQVLPSSMLDNPQNADENLAKGIQHWIQLLLHFKSSLIHLYCMVITAFFKWIDWCLLFFFPAISRPMNKLLLQFARKVSRSTAQCHFSLALNDLLLCGHKPQLLSQSPYNHDF